MSDTTAFETTTVDTTQVGKPGRRYRLLCSAILKAFYKGPPIGLVRSDAVTLHTAENGSVRPYFELVDEVPSTWFPMFPEQVVGTFDELVAYFKTILAAAIGEFDKYCEGPCFGEGDGVIGRDHDAVCQAAGFDSFRALPPAPLPSETLVVIRASDLGGDTVYDKEAIERADFS